MGNFSPFPQNTHDYFNSAWYYIYKRNKNILTASFHFFDEIWKTNSYQKPKLNRSQKLTQFKFDFETLTIFQNIFNGYGICEPLHNLFATIWHRKVFETCLWAQIFIYRICFEFSKHFHSRISSTHLQDNSWRPI